ncbi:B9D2 protein, partial [Todus mexicanus]|nr:B9D2 protein [Todus mexicanus]
GFCHVPATPGWHPLTCPTWIPLGSYWDQFRNWLVGGRPQLLNWEVAGAANERFRLRTESSGKVHLEFGVVLRNFGRYGVLG